MKKAYYTTETVNDHITAIWSACGEVMYLICGEKRALLMDTNLGVGHLKELVDSLTDKPYDVVLTHGHIDHAPGASEFEHVYGKAMSRGSGSTAVSIFPSAILRQSGGLDSMPSGFRYPILFSETGTLSSGVWKNWIKRSTGQRNTASGS